MQSTQRSDSPLKNRLETASYLRISPRKVDYLAAAGELAVTRIGGRVLFAKAELDRFIAANTATAERSSAGTLAEARA